MTSGHSLNFSYANGKPLAEAFFRQKNEDFVVQELLGFEPAGEGEHLFVQLQKEGENTQWVADKLAKYFAVKSMDVSYAGQKDRHAVTTQWFSVYLPGKEGEVDWPDFIRQSELNARVLKSARHSKKLRRGQHRANAFTIRLRQMSDMNAAVAVLQNIISKGVPNYFGEQRFGREGGNLRLAKEWIEEGAQIKNRNKRSMVMSAARSYLFNSVLSQRVVSETWQQALLGDIAEKFPTGPLWGRGRPLVSAATASIESDALSDLSSWCDHLEHVGLKQERRPLVLKPLDLVWRIEGEDLVLDFSLAPGEFATSVLREICCLKSKAQDGL